jgi:hypothetical protein
MVTNQKRDALEDDTVGSEPIGIIISRGRRDEPVPAFSAFVWGAPASDAERVGMEPRAA